MRYRVLPVAAATLILITALAGCSRPGAAVKASGSAAPTASKSATAIPSRPAAEAARSDINQQDRESLAAGGRLRFAVTSFAETWNPLHVNGQEPDYAAVRAPMTPRFFVADAAGHLSYDPNWLQAEPTVDAAGTVTLRLNPKAAWNDGAPIALADFQATWKACNGADVAFECALPGMDRVTGITQGGDAQTIVLKFDSPYPDWRRLLLNGPLRASSAATAAAFNTGWGSLAGHDGWFSGPFKLGRYDDATKTIVLVRNPAWWGNPALLDEIDFTAMDRDQQVPAYLNGDIDALEVGVDVEAFKRASQVSAGAIRHTGGVTSRQLALNAKAPELADPAIRKAIVQALDRVAIGNVDLAGLDWQVRELNSHLFLAGQEGYVDLAADTGLKFDRLAAAKTLETAGWQAGSDGYRYKAGKRLVLSFTTLTGVKSSENTGLQLLNQLKPLGIEVRLVPIAPTDFAQTLQSGGWQLISYTADGGLFPFALANDYFNSLSEQNYSGLADQAIDGQIDAISGELDPAKRQAEALELERLAWQAAVLLPLYQRPDQVAVSSRLANFGAFGLATPVWENVGYTK